MSVQRANVEPGIWRRGDVLAITRRGQAAPAHGHGGIIAARRALKAQRARRDRGDRVGADPRPRCEQAADAWPAGPVATPRPNTHSTYRGAVERHLRQRIGRHRLDDITPDDMARVWPSSEPPATASGRSPRC
jgi:hypothetical protein